MNDKGCMGFLRSLLLIFVSVSLLVSCGGGGGDSAPAPTPTTQSANGVWSGTLVDNINGTFTLDCLIYEGDIIAISEDAGRIYKGTYTVSGNNLAGNVNAYEIGGGLVDAGTMNGTVVEQVSLTATFQSQATTGSISVIFDQIYNRDSALPYVEGNWSGVNGSYSMDLTIDSAGGISGSDSDGCIATGVVSTLDPDKNLYGIDVDFAQCGIYNGTYDGLAGLADNNSPNDTLVAAISNSNYTMLYSFARQVNTGEPPATGTQEVYRTADWYDFPVMQSYGAYDHFQFDKPTNISKVSFAAYASRNATGDFDERFNKVTIKFFTNKWENDRNFPDQEIVSYEFMDYKRLDLNNFIISVDIPLTGC